MTNRLFIALKLPLEIREEVSEIIREVHKPSANKRWEPKEKLHLTVKFLGNVEEEKLQKVINSFNEAVSGYSKIHASYEKFGFFLPRILWLSLQAGNHLEQMVENIEDRFYKIGFEKENRQFKAHITLLRIKDNPDPEFINAFRNYKLPEREFDITEAALIKSTLKPTGSVYTDIKTIILHNGG